MIDKQTLLAWRAEFLEELQDLLGKRDDSYVLGDIGMCALSDQGPHTGFRDENTRVVDLYLSQAALSREDRGVSARSQIADLCVHLIDPCFPPGTNVLEVGIAVWYGFQKMREVLPLSEIDVDNSKVEPLAAFHLVNPYMEAGYLLTKVKLLRDEGSRIGNITKADLLRVADRVTTEDSEKLVRRYDPGKIEEKRTVLDCQVLD